MAGAVPDLAARVTQIGDRQYYSLQMGFGPGFDQRLSLGLLHWAMRWSRRPMQPTIFTPGPV